MSSHRSPRLLTLLVLVSIGIFFVSHGCRVKHTAEVTATAYNSLPGQTTRKRPDLTAWGDVLKPGMKAIAVSRDLIKKGLTHGTRVKIEGLNGTYVVRDKMHKRWKNKIDIYMGTNVKAARKWGKRKVRITWSGE